MTVREFDFTAGDNLVTDIGVLASMVFGTFAALVKPANTDSERNYVTLLHGSGGNTNHLGVSLIDNEIAFWNGDDHSVTNANVISGNWMMFVVRKAAGSQTPRFSVYDLGTDSWTHVNGGSSLSNASSGPGASGTVRFSSQNSRFFDGRVALRAVWSNITGPGGAWTADATGDTAIENSGLDDSTQNWISATPDALWLFNQAETSDDVGDLSGNGANQISVDGTSVVTGDDPPNFFLDVQDMSASGTGTGTLSATITGVGQVDTGAMRGDGTPLQPYVLTDSGLA